MPQAGEGWDSRIWAADSLVGEDSTLNSIPRSARFRRPSAMREMKHDEAKLGKSLLAAWDLQELVKGQRQPWVLLLKQDTGDDATFLRRPS